MKTSKSPFNQSILKTASLLASLGLVSGNVAIAKAGSDRLLIGPERPHTLGYGTTSGEGYLLVYSATEESSDGDLEFNPHSSYVIHTSNGKFVKNVENHMSRSDELPEHCEVNSRILYRRSSISKGRIRSHSGGD